MLSPRLARWLGPLLGLASVAVCTTAASAPPPLPGPGEATELRLCVARDQGGLDICLITCRARAAHAVWLFNPVTGGSQIFDCEDLVGPPPTEERI